MKIPWGVLIWRLPKVIYEVNMSCLRIDIKRLYNSITVRIVLGVLFFLAIVDPLYSRFFTKNPQKNHLKRPETTPKMGQLARV